MDRAWMLCARGRESAIRIAHDNNVAPGTSLPPLVDPRVCKVAWVFRPATAGPRTARPALRRHHVLSDNRYTRTPSSIYFGTKPPERRTMLHIADEH